MAEIAPFKGLTYDIERLKDLSLLVAPPYDVISEEEQEALYRLHPYNIVRLILGKKKLGDTDWDNRYTRASDLFARWQSESVLVRAEKPALYITSLTYDPRDGKGDRERLGFVALVRIEDEGSKVILPHERTFSAHKDDRLRLMRACNAQFSQIFGLYEDPGDLIFQSLKDVLQTPPRFDFKFRDQTHKMWVVCDREIIAKVAAAMSDKRIFIADGHHRYETARNYRNIMRARYGGLPPNRAYEYVAVSMTNMYDKGLTVLPSHRLIRRCANFDIGPFLHCVERWFRVTEIGPDSRAGSLSRLDRFQRLLSAEGGAASALGFHLNGHPKDYVFSLKPECRSEMGDDLHPSLKELDVLVLSRFIFQKALGFSREDLDDEEIFQYRSDMESAFSLVDSGAFKMAFLLNPTKIDHVKAVATHSLIMPRKSTYFYPKILSGMVFNKIDPHELIQHPLG